MTTDRFLQSVLRTWRLDLTAEERLLNAEAGLLGETGELSDHLKKHLFQGHDYDREYVKKELGDIFYYIFALWYEQGKSIETMKLTLLNAFGERRHAYKTVFNALADLVIGTRNNRIMNIINVIYTLDFHLSDILLCNIDKLNARYPHGFSEKASRERVV